VKKRKLDEIGQELASGEGHNKVMVWNLAVQPHQRVAIDIDFVLGAFVTTNKLMVYNLNNGVDRLTQQILDI
jgi:hypothetical protein